MMYSVAVYASDSKEWVEIGPVFTDRNQAVRFMESLPTRTKRLIQTPSGGEALDLRHLEFARFLVETGRLTEQSGAR